MHAVVTIMALGVSNALWELVWQRYDWRRATEPPDSFNPGLAILIYVTVGQG
jgi:hypothetical protein